MRDGVVEKVPQLVFPSLLREANFYSLDNLTSALQVLEEDTAKHWPVSCKSVSVCGKGGKEAWEKGRKKRNKCT